MTAHLIEGLGLQAHREGGYFRRTYTSPHLVETPGGERPTATSILYLMTGARRRGRLHRNRSDILHYFLEGGPIDYLIVDPAGELRRERLGPGGSLVLLVPGGHWKASELPAESAYGLVAEMVTPGFDFADHEFATEPDLAEFPDHRGLLRPFLAAEPAG